MNKQPLTQLSKIIVFGIFVDRRKIEFWKDKCVQLNFYFERLRDKTHSPIKYIYELIN